MPHADPSDLEWRLLRIAASRADTRAWCADVRATIGAEDAAAIEHAQRQLVARGWLRLQGTPRTGWLTPEGARALRATPAVVLAAPVVIERSFSAPTSPAVPATGEVHFASLTLRQFQQASERAYWQRLLAATRGNVSAATRLAGVSRSTADKRLGILGLRAWDHRL